VDKIVKNIEEVVLAVKDQEEVVAMFEDLFGLDFKDSWTVPEDKMNVRSAKIGDTQFHVVASETQDAVIGKYIRDRGEGIHHICFKVSNLDELIARLKEKGVRLVPEIPRRGRTSRFIFVHPKSVHGVMIELMEHNKP
jgi:methylmalonyl-CoA/ethylmalonyl-CoA epimerase